MARYPFKEKADEYMESRRGCISEQSWNVQSRRYTRMERELMELNRQGVISSVSPAKMTPEDVKAYIIFRKERGVGASDLNHDITAMKQLLIRSGNSAVEVCLQNNEGLKPKNKQRRLNPLSEDSYVRILKAYEEVDHSDFTAVRPFAMVILYIVTGARNQELRLCKVSDLDTVEWVIHFENVKGADTYGEPRDVAIPSEVHDIVANYLMLRQVWLQCHNHTSEALFFALGGDCSYLSGNSIRRLKKVVEDAIDEKFELRDCRRSFGQFCLNKGVDLQHVSRLMGHNTTKTTEEYYCRKSNRDALDDLKRKW